MTEIEKEEIARYRDAGYSYNDIAKMTGIKLNSIKTYCRRHGLGGNVGLEEKPDDSLLGTCENCGGGLVSKPGRKKKRFCSDKCRNQWWNSHLDLVNKKANYEHVCAYCKKTFVSYGKKERRYCSHECYVEDRFGGVN